MSFQGRWLIKGEDGNTATLDLTRSGDVLTGSLTTKEGDVLAIENGSCEKEGANWIIRVTKPIEMEMFFVANLDQEKQIHGTIKFGSFAHVSYTGSPL